VGRTARAGRPGVAVRCQHERAFPGAFSFGAMFFLVRWIAILVQVVGGVNVCDVCGSAVLSPGVEKKERERESQRDEEEARKKKCFPVHPPFFFFFNK
jgi:hypothetical protein